jgi:hypothetical protein
VSEGTSVPTLTYSADIVDAVERTWSSEGLSDETLGCVIHQERWRHAMREAVGSTWSRIQSFFAEALDRAPHIALFAPQVRDVAPVRPLLGALAVALGQPEDPYRASWSRVLQDVPSRAGPDSDSRWHVDSPGWRETNDITCLLCFRSARHGGETQFLTWQALLAALREQPGLFEAACNLQVPWLLDQGLGGGVVYSAVLSSSGLRYMAESLTRAAESCPTDHVLSKTCAALISLVDPLEPTLSIRLEPGEILVFDNKRVLHRRGPMVGGETRLLVRSRLTNPAWVRQASSLELAPR